MEFSQRDLEHLERLARIRLSEGSREELRGQLERIIEFVRILQGIDTAGFEPEAALEGNGAELRADEERSCLPREAILGEAPDRRGVFFGVPPVIDTEEP